MIKEILNKIRRLLTYKLSISIIISGILTNFFIIKLDIKEDGPGRVADYLWYDWKNLSQTDSS